MLNINFVTEKSKDTEAITFLIDKNLRMDQSVINIDHQCHGLISKVIQNKTIFNGTFGQSKVLPYTNKEENLNYIILIGIGEEQDLTEYALEQIGGKVINIANNLKISNVGVELINKLNKFESAKVASLVASGALLGSYRFDKYFKDQKDEVKALVSKLEVVTNNLDLAENLFLNKKNIASGVFFARDCINEPPNILYPESYAEIIIQKLEPLGIDIEVLGEREMRNIGMGALIGVGQGSTNESKLVVMEYNGSDTKQHPIAFVGKGVTFDSGGISLKPSAGMEDMKYDMSGSAAIVGLIEALALREAKVNVVGILGLVENMPGGNAQRPSDIVTTMSGKTVEVLNTDAEGRLVLADAIWYTQDKFNPSCIIDLATLTGAIKVALGPVYAGVFSNDDELAKKLIKSGNIVNEMLWHMPLNKEYDEMLKSTIADIANISTPQGEGAGASTAAHFIGRFIKKGTLWAHLDIASVAWDKRGKDISPKGAVGFGVRLLNQFIEDYYEEK